MLTSCPKCGKPVYSPNGWRTGECGYCYAQLRFSDMPVLKPEMLDWKKPLYDEAVAAKAPEKAFCLLVLLGDYADVPQRLERIRGQELEKIRNLENEIGLATEVWRLDQIIKNLQEINRTFIGGEAADRALAAALEKKTRLKQKEDQKNLRELKERVETAKTADDIGFGTLRDIEALLHMPGAAELLEKAKAKEEAFQREKDLAMLERLKEAIQKERFSWALNGLIEDIRKIKSGPEAESVVMLAYEKRAKLLEAEEKERVKRERWEKRKKWIKGSAAAVILLGIVTCCLLSYHVFQPEKLEKARALAREEQYAEAAAAYRSLAINGLFSNPAVAARAGDELKALLNEWALVLVEQGDRKAAIEKYEEAGNTDAVLDNRKAYAEEAEEKGLLQEAINQYEQLPDTEEKISELYARLVVQYLEQENYELALNSFDRSDRELMQLYQITKGEIYRLWGKALAEQGRTDDAIQKLKKATDSDETLDLLQALYVRQADEKGRQLLEQWEKDGRKKDARQLRQFADTGAKLNTVNAQLHYWKLLAEADIDITQVYPAGVEVNDFLLSAYTSVFEEYDASKPLFFIREEKEYTISMTDVSGSSGGKAVHDPQDPAYFTVTLLPELWQRLPKERRAASLRECTCIFVLDQTYQSAGTYYGKYRVKNYVAEMYTKQTGRKAPVSSKTLESKGVFPLYTARMALLVWNYPGNEAKVLVAKTNEAHYKPNFLTGGSMVVDWSNESSYSVSTIKLGLSGKFDQDWVTETVQSCYDTVLGMGGE